MALDGIKAGIDRVYTVIETAFAKLGIDLGTIKDAVIKTIVDFKELVISKILSIIDAIIDLRDKLISRFVSLITAVGDIFQKVKDIITHMLELPKKFYEMLQELFRFLFVPRDGFLDEKIAALIEKFPFVEQIIEIGDSLKAFVSGMAGNTPPVVTLNLGSATNKYGYGGGTVKVLDMSWYAPYKRSTDLIISSIMWICFAWRLFHRIPSLINGVSSNHGAIESVMKTGKE